MPQFNGVNAYIKFPCLENVRRSFSIDIWFLATALNGALLYNGQLHNRRGDFIAINLVNGYVQFRYDLGSGLANITYVIEGSVHIGGGERARGVHFVLEHISKAFSLSTFQITQ